MIIKCKNMAISEVIKNKFQKFSNFEKKKKNNNCSAEKRNSAF